MDMAVGVIVGGAFTAIITALSDHILKPVINWLLALIFGKNSLTEIYTFLKPAYVDGQIDLANSIYIDWGAFINAIINFLIIAFVLFCIVKGLNSLANARANLVGGVATDERKAVAAYRRQGMTKAQAKAKYAEDVAKAEAEKAEQERLEKEAEEAKATAQIPVCWKKYATHSKRCRKKAENFEPPKKGGFSCARKTKSIFVAAKVKKTFDFCKP